MAKMGSNPYKNGHRYYALDLYLRECFGQKVYKLALDGGFSCPNRDGTLDSRGCIFCSAGGSGDFAASRRLSVTDQINSQIQKAGENSHRDASSYIAYFQAYTNTYAPYDTLRALFYEAIAHPKICGLSIATRPDCLPPDTVALLAKLSRIKPVWIELGLQTIHEESARYIRRGYPLAVFTDAVERLYSAGLKEIIVHVILGLPGEDREDMLATIRYLNTLPVKGIKLQLLHILAGTDLALDYQAGRFEALSREAYTDLVIDCLEHLSPDIVIHRLTGDGPKELLLAPDWSLQKKAVLNDLRHQMKLKDSWQGKYFKAAPF